MRKSVLVLGGVAMLVGTALWFESMYQKASKPVPVQPIQHATPQRNDSTEASPPLQQNAPSEQGLLIG